MSTKVIDATVNASLDVGKNITDLLQKIAEKIGTTVDKIFPWYVKQVYIYSWVELISITLAFFIGFGMVLYSKNKTDFENGNGYCYVLCLGAVMMFIASLVFFCMLPSIITAINNPEYQALSMLVDDMSRILKR
jgi:ABC-type amino acid transport system permease subunit